METVAAIIGIVFLLLLLSLMYIPLFQISREQQEWKRKRDAERDGRKND